MKVIVNNLAVNYLDEGSGRVILLLHGWGTNVANMQGLSHHLATKFRVISVDFPGFGQSQYPGADWHVGDYASFVADFLRKLDVTDLYAVIGHSFGGRVTIKGVSNRHFTPAKIILIGSAGIKHADSMRNVGYKVVAKTGKKILSLPGLSKLSDRAKQSLYKSAGSTDYANSGEMKQIFLNTINEDLSDDASKITTAALLIWGEHDDESPVTDAQRFNELITGSTLHVISGAGHFVHTENTDQIYPLIDEFLA